MRIKVFLQCEECKRRNYTTTKSKRPGSGKIHLKKYCPHCKKHTNHKEVKI